MLQSITNFQKHVDNVNETISAHHINEVQEAVNELEQNMRETIRQTLLGQAFKTFGSSDKTCMIVLSNPHDYSLDKINSYGVEVVNESDLRLQAGYDQGVYMSRPILSHLDRNDSLLSEISLLLSGNHESHIECGIVTKEGNYYSFDQQGVSEFLSKTTSFQVKINLTRIPSGESPTVQFMTVYYNDSSVSEELNSLLKE